MILLFRSVRKHILSCKNIKNSLWTEPLIRRCSRKILKKAESTTKEKPFYRNQGEFVSFKPIFVGKFYRLYPTIRERLCSGKIYFPRIREHKCRKFSRKFLPAKACTPKVHCFFREKSKTYNLVISNLEKLDSRRSYKFL